MRLLKSEDDGRVSLTEYPLSEAPDYAILSHTWGRPDDEVTFRDINDGSARQKKAYQKIEFCRKHALADGLQYFWVDTCCIDKANHSELSEAINSMFRWYSTAKVCYVYLSDVSTEINGSSTPWETQFQQSRWFRRGWTLQELLAPVSVRFYGTSLDSRLRGSSLAQIPVHERLHWSHSRQTTKEEDAAYCLLGIFDVYIPLIYGEGKSNALSRLLEAIERRTSVPHNSSSQHTTHKSYLIVPFGQNDDFVGREVILADLVKKIPPSAGENDCQRTVIEGLGGMGKTQVALEAAYRVHKQDPDCSVFWVPAITQITFENGFREIGKALETPGLDEDKADVKALVKVALAKSTSRWLLIIDNLDDIGLLSSGGLQDYLPFNRKGSILFTTRNHEVTIRLDVSTRNIFTISEMGEAEALELLQSGLKPRQFQDTQTTKDLLQHLTYMPLAIKQASAYMGRTGETTTVYLKRYLTSDADQVELLNAEFEDRHRYSKDSNPITMTWLISFQHLEQSYPLAVEYLKFVCFLAEKDIPISLLPSGQDEKAESEAIGILEGYAFIAIREQGDSFDIHRLVRLVTRNWIKSKWEIHSTEVVQHLAQVYPFPEHENQPIWTRYIPHAETVLEVQEHCTDQEARADLLFVVADSYDELAKYEEAEQVHRQTLELRKSVLGPEHRSTLDSMNNLALVLNSQGKYDEAEQMHRQTLELCKLVLGPEHPSTLSSMNNLALVLNSQGKYEEAEQMHWQTLEVNKSSQGPEHPSTLDSMNNLALILDSQGKYEEAEQMHRQTLELRKLVLGPEHPSTLSSMNNLANVLGSQGKYEEAEQMHRQTLKLMESVLGPEHPSTLSSMNNLANVLGSQGKYEEAEQMHRQTLKLRESVLGLEHPVTLNSMNNLANVLNSQGKHKEAEQMHRPTLELRESVLGPEHPSTLSSMNNLANVLDNQGKYDEAEQMHRQTLELKESVLGPEHPSTLDSMNNLAEVLRHRGKYGEAEQIHRQTLELRKTVLDSDHISTMQSRRNLQHGLDARDGRRSNQMTAYRRLPKRRRLL